MTKENEVAVIENRELATSASIPQSMGDILKYAIDKGAGVDQIEKMMELQERYERNEAKKAYVRAMSLFRSKCPSIVKTKEAHNNKYAGLAETIDQLKALLAECGLSHSWKTDTEDKIKVTCYLTHEMGHSESTSMSGPPDSSGSKNAIQAIASTISYLERYTFFAILGLASSEMDDDGTGAGIEYINDEQMITINEWIESIGGECLKNFKKYMGVDSLDKIPAKDYKKAITALKNTEKKKKESIK